MKYGFEALVIGLCVLLGGSWGFFAFQKSITYGIAGAIVGVKEVETMSRIDVAIVILLCGAIGLILKLATSKAPDLSVSFLLWAIVGIGFGTMLCVVLILTSKRKGRGNA